MTTEDRPSRILTALQDQLHPLGVSGPAYRTRVYESESGDGSLRFELALTSWARVSPAAAQEVPLSELTRAVAGVLLRGLRRTSVPWRDPHPCGTVVEELGGPCGRPGTRRFVKALPNGGEQVYVCAEHALRYQEAVARAGIDPGWYEAPLHPEGVS